MRVVIDTNVVVAAVLRDRDPETVIQFVVGAGDVEWIATPAIIREYQEVLGRPKFALSRALLDEWEGLLRAAVVIVDGVPDVPWPDDPGDAMLVACALASKADYLITGDKALLHAGKLGSTTVITISQFKREIVDRAG